MEFRVERCFPGDRFRVSKGWRGSDRMWHYVHTDAWDRAAAKESKDYLSYHHNIKRKNIRFYLA